MNLLSNNLALDSQSSKPGPQVIYVYAIHWLVLTEIMPDQQLRQIRSKRPTAHLQKKRGTDQLEICVLVVRIKELKLRPVETKEIVCERASCFWFQYSDEAQAANS